MGALMWNGILNLDIKDGKLWVLNSAAQRMSLLGRTPQTAIDKRQ